MRKIDRIARKERNENHEEVTGPTWIPTPVDETIEEDEELFLLTCEEDDGVESFPDTCEEDESEREAENELRRERREWYDDFLQNAERLRSEKHFYDDEAGEEIYDAKTGKFVRIAPGMHLVDPKDDD